MTEWRAVVGFEGKYEVSSTGLVRRIGKGHGARIGYVLKPTLDSWGGYPRVVLGRGGKHFVHRLVAAAFIGECPIGKEVNHRDLNRQNPSARNLEYLTRPENNRHAYANGRVALKGEQAPQHKLTEEQARYALQSSETQRAVAARFGVSHGVIGRIRRGEKWRHLSSSIS